MDSSKLPPHSPGAEQAVLGSVLVDARVWPLVSFLTAGDFYRSDHARIYAAIAETVEAGDGVDIVTVGDRLEAQAANFDTGGSAYLAELAMNVPAPTNAGWYARIVRAYRSKRDAIRATVEAQGALLNGSREPLAAIADRLSAELRELVGDQADAGPVLSSMADVLAMPDEALEFVVEDLLPRGGVSLMAAFAKAGKTTLAAVLALAVARGERFLGRETRRGPVMYLSFEDHPVAFRDRLLALGATADDPIYSMTGYLPAGLDSLAWLRALVDRHRPAFVKRLAESGRLIPSEGARAGTFRYSVPHATGAI